MHTNIFDFSAIRSLSHNNFFLNFMDDFKRKTLIYLLKENFDAFKKFKVFKVLVKRLRGTFPGVSFWDSMKLLVACL